MGVKRIKRIAYHEAGHAVLSAAINDSPHHVSIRAVGQTLGRARYRMDGRPEFVVQVYLAGYAAEHLLLAHQQKHSKQMRREVDFTIASLEPDLSFIAEGLEGTDGYLAVHALAKIFDTADGDVLRAHIDRFFDASSDSLRAVWPAVGSVAKALLSKTELDHTAFRSALREEDIYGPVFDVQRAHGFLPRTGRSV